MSSSTLPPESGKKTWSVGTLTYTRSGLATLFFLLLVGDLVWALRERSISPITQLLFKNHGASDFMNAVMLRSIPTAMGMIISPIIGFHSDRFRSRFGRRIPFLFVTTPVVLLGMIGMGCSKWLVDDLLYFFPTWSADQAALWILSAAWILFEGGVLMATVVFFCLINDVVPASLLGRFFALFRIVGLLVGIGFNYFFFGYAEQHHETVFITLAVIYGVGIILMCLLVKEGEYPPVPENSVRTSKLKVAMEYLGHCAGSSYYWLLFAMLIVVGLAWIPAQTFVAFYAKQLNISMDYYGKLGAYSYMASLVLAYPLGVWVDRFHPLRCVMVVLGLYFAVSLFNGFFIRDQLTFTIGFIIQVVISGTYWTVSAPLTMRLFPRAQYAQFGIVGGALNGIICFFGIPLLGKFLDYTGHCYQYTFFMASGLSLAGLILMFCYYRKFKELGGVKNFVAPEF